MRVALTGATGFVGRHVLRELLAHDVEIVDVRRHIPDDHVDDTGRVSVVAWDLTRAEGAFDAMGRPDLLLHLAWEGLPNYQASRHLDTELPAQARFLLGCMDDGLRALSVAGTCFEYGLTEGEIAESHAAAPVTCYGMAKLELHRVVAQRAAELDVGLDWARFFYLFGEGQGSGSLYSQLMSAIQDGRERFDMSPGDQGRDFLPVEEAARLFTKVALSQGGKGTVNICSGHATTIIDLVETWVARRHGRLSLNRGHFPYPTFEPHTFWGNRDRLDAIIAEADLHTDGEHHEPV